MTGPANIGALFRLAEAMGVSQVLFDSTINPESRRMQKTARSTFENVEYRDGVNLKQAVLEHKEAGFSIIGLELTTDSRPLQSIDKKKKERWFLLIGNEQNGIEESLLEKVEHRMHIPMFGSNSSMNVIQATAMALYELRRDE